MGWGFFFLVYDGSTCRFPPPELKRRGGGRGNAPGREGLSTQIDWFVPIFFFAGPYLESLLMFSRSARNDNCTKARNPE
jgi:hypothetical protein